MADYRLVTRFEITAPIAAVWTALTRPEVWIGGWGEVVDAVAIDPDRDDPTGARHHFRLRPVRFATLSFETEITRARRPDVIAWSVTGDLDGEAHWELDDLDGLTIGRNTWRVRTTPAWLNALAPAARRVYRRCQDDLMANGLRAMADHLGGGLLTVSTTASQPERHRFAGVALRIGPGASSTSSDQRTSPAALHR